jgi:beta-lactamase regulating signal transducer with metallopeptidase domain
MRLCWDGVENKSKTPVSLCEPGSRREECMDFERWLSLLEGALAVALIRGAVVYLLAVAATALGMRLSSQARHLIWLGVVASFLLLPLCWLALPALRVGGWVRPEAAATYGIAAAPLIAREEYVRFAHGAREGARSGGLSLAGYLRLLAPALLLTWLAGALFLGARLLVGRRKLRLLRRGAAKDPKMQRLARELAAGAPACRRLEVLRSRRCGVPFTFGLRRPVIVLPAGAACWPAGRLRSALVHELAHIRRRDVLTQSLAYGVCLLFWLSPPLWLAYAALLREAETCCDQQVINRGFRRGQYARGLLELALRSAGRILAPAVPCEVKRPGGLSVRIRRLMRLQPERRPFGALGALRVVAFCLLCLLPLLTVTCAAKPPRAKPCGPSRGTSTRPSGLVIDQVHV